MILRQSKSTVILALAFAGSLIATRPTWAQAPYTPSPMVQVPIASTYVGVPAASYSSAAAGSSCASTTVGYLTVNDGCPASQETLYYTYNLALDSSNDLVIANYGSGQNSTSGLAVLYQGGATMASVLTAGKPGYSFTPLVGHVYLLANAGQIKAVGGVYNCGGSAANGQALDQWGDGCPAQYAATQSRSVTMDASGNIFFGQVYASTTYYQGLKVLYAGGTAVANLITSYFTAHCQSWPVGIAASVITTSNICSQGLTPKVGYVYALSAPGDFIAIRGVGVQTNSSTGAETIFAADNGATTAETGLAASTSGNQIKQFNGTGWITYINGNLTGSATAVQGDGGPATSAAVDLPSYSATDQYGNFYFIDVSDARIRVIYNGGVTPPLYVEGSGGVTSPQVGYVYSVAGGGTSRSSPVTASSLSIGSAAAVGVDQAGNVYLTDGSKLTWIVSQTTGVAQNIAGAGTTTAFGSVSGNPLPGVACNGSTSPATGPLMTDAYADGCPATEVSPIGGLGTIVIDSAGNFYMAENRVVTGATAIVRKYSYNGQFGSQATNATATNVLAFTPYNRTTTYTPTATYTGSSDFADGGGGTCSLVGAPVTGSTLTPVQTCTYNVNFTPTRAGLRAGALTVSAAGSTLGSAYLGGTGLGAQLAFDPGLASTVGSGLAPAGVAIDPNGTSIYIVDATSNSILKSNSGGAPITFATGFSKPAQVAAAATGSLYVADTGNNRIAVVAPGTATAATFIASANSIALNKPSGVALDTSGDIFISDTGNNRILEVPYDNGLYARVIQLSVSGLSAPQGLTLDAAGDIFIADSGNARVVELSATGIQSTISVSPSLANPVGVALDAAGDLFIADSGNQNVIVVPAGTSAAASLRGSLTGLSGVAVDTVGDVYIAASSQTGILSLARGATTLTYPQINIGKTSSQTFALTNSGNAAFTFGSSLLTSSDPLDFSVTPANTNGCSTLGTLAPGANCSISGLFQPQSVSANLVDVVTFPASNAANASSGAAVTLSGPSQLGLTYSFGAPGSIPNSINVSFVATLSLPTPSPALTGNVTFTIGTTSTVVAVSGGGAKLTVPLTAGIYTVTATYSGASYTQAVITTTTITVVTGTSSVALSVTSPTGAITYGQSVVVTAVTTTGNSPATPGGTVIFTVNNVPQTPITFAPSVSTTLTLQAGTYTISASYSGDPNFVPSANSIGVVVGRATPTLKLVPTPVVGSTGNSIALVATLAAAPTYPTGSVAFTYGSTAIGAPVSLSSGSASAATSTNALSSYAFTATYNGDANFLPATVTVTPSPVLVVSALPASLTILQNSVGQVSVNLNSFYGYTASSVSFLCSNAPAYTVCDPAPITTPVPADQITSVPFQIFTDAPPLAVTAQMEGHGRQLGVVLAGMLLLCFVPHVRRHRWTKLIVFMIASAGLLSASGCGSNTTDTNQYITPTGSYSMLINVTDGKALYTLPYTLTVTPGYLTARPN